MTYTKNLQMLRRASLYNRQENAAPVSDIRIAFEWCPLKTICALLRFLDESLTILLMMLHFN